MKQTSIMTCLNALLTTNGNKYEYRPLRRTVSSLNCTDKLVIPTKSNNTSFSSETQINYESIIFVCHDLLFESNSDLFNFLQSINGTIKTFTDSLLCLNWIESSNDRIFFISSSTDEDLITLVHDCRSVEAIFLINSEAQISKNDFPKLVGVFNQHEELFMAVEDMLPWFEQSKLEMFAFENNKVFLWSQLWKEERLSTKTTSNKDQLVDMAQNLYHDNTKMLKFVKTFYESYRSNDAFRWCFRSPFPSCPLNNALRSHNNEQLNFYSFLLNDVSRLLKKRPKRNSVIQFYRGMKLPTEIIDKFEKHTGKLVCVNGFFICTKSRTTAMTLAASSPSQYSDLSPVLFKIDCDPSVSFAELSTDGESVQTVFDVHTSFRVTCVNRGQMSIIKLKTANEEGRQIAREYMKKHKENNIRSLLNELLISSKPPPSTVPNNTTLAEISSSTVSPDEIQAQEHLTRGEIDFALAAYRRIVPVSPRILNLIGQIYTENLYDKDSAFVCHMQALKMQGEKGEDVSDTLTNMAIIYHKRQKFDLALSYHTQALTLREAIHPPNSLLIANNLRGIANAHYGQHQLPDALENAQRALNIYQSLTPIDEKNTALTLSILASIYHDYKDHARAVQLGIEARVLLERCVSNNSLVLAAAFHNLAKFQFNLQLLDDARNNYENALNICVNVFPPEHPKRVSLVNDIERIILMQKESTDGTTNDIVE